MQYFLNRPKRCFGLGLALSMFLVPGLMPWAGDGPGYVQSVEQDRSQQGLTVGLESDWFARQGGAVVSQADLDTYMERIPEAHRSGFLISTQRVGQMLRNLMLVRLLAVEAEKDGVLDDPSLNARIFQAASVLIAEAYRDQFFQERELESYEQRAREIYLSDPGQFRTEEGISFTHILVDSGQQRGETAAMRRVLEVYEQLQEGAPLEDLVAEYSDDPQAAENQGRYENVNAGELDDTVADALTILQPGHISEPVRSGFGWHIFRVDDRHPARQLEWEEAKNQAIERARQRHFEDTLERLYRRLLDAPIEVADGALDALLNRYGVDSEDGPTNQEIIDYQPD